MGAQLPYCAVFFYALTKHTLPGPDIRPKQSRRKPGEESDTMSDENEVIESRAEKAAELFGSEAALTDDTSPEQISDEQVPEATVVEDPWSGLPSAVREHIQQLTDKVQTLDAREFRLKQAEQRIGSLTNEFHASRQAAATVAKAPTESEIADASTSRKEWDSLKADFPEWGSAIEGKLAAERAELSRTLPDTMRAEIDSRTSQAEERLLAKLSETSRKLEMTRLTAQHPDAFSIRDSVEYGAWLQSQSMDMRQLAATSQDADEAATVLDAYKKSNQYSAWAGNKPTKTVREIAADRDKRLRQAQSTPGRHLQPPKNEADMSIEELRQIKASRLWPQKGQ